MILGLLICSFAKFPGLPSADRKCRNACNAIRATPCPVKQVCNERTALTDHHSVPSVAFFEDVGVGEPANVSTPHEVSRRPNRIHPVGG